TSASGSQRRASDGSRGCLPPENDAVAAASCRYFLYYRRFGQAIDSPAQRFEGIGNAEQRFGMPDEQIAARLKPFLKAGKKAALSRLVEIDDDVPTEDDVEAHVVPDGPGVIQQIDPFERDLLAQGVARLHEPALR